MFRLKTNTKLTASQVKKVFEEQFTTRITEASPELNEHEKNVKQFLQNHRPKMEPKMEPKIIIRRARLSMILKKLRNGKRAGFSGVTYEMFKYTFGHNWELIDLLCELFSDMLNSGDLPYLFNITIMIPLIKDHKKELDDPNNLRPISISDAISNIFEMLILV